MATKKVLIIQEVMKQYRLPFYRELVRQLAPYPVNLTVAYSLPDAVNRAKSDNVLLPEPPGKIVAITRLLSGRLVYQHVLADILAADLVIVEQANKHLVNLILIILSRLGLKKFAFWGHGRNFQSLPDTAAEKFKRCLVTSPAWWFAYTAQSADYVAGCGYARTRITPVANSIDVEALSDMIDGLDPNEVSAFKQSLGFAAGARTGLYCGAMYPEKMLPFLLESLLHIKQAMPDFCFIFIGAGPEQVLVEDFVRQHPWAVYLGPVFDQRKAVAFAAAGIVLNPGLVGLGVLDAFAAGLPLATTDYPFHSPEIAYLQHDENGIVTVMDTHNYAQQVVALLNDPEQLARMAGNAKQSSRLYSIANMARNFSDGIRKALELA